MSERVEDTSSSGGYATAGSKIPEKVGTRGRPIEYDDGTFAAIVNTEHGVIVEVREPEGGFEVTGFPTAQDAYNFLMWADLRGEDGDIPPALHYQNQLKWVYG